MYRNADTRRWAQWTLTGQAWFKDESREDTGVCLENPWKVERSTCRQSYHLMSHSRTKAGQVAVGGVPAAGPGFSGRRGRRWTGGLQVLKRSLCEPMPPGKPHWLQQGGRVATGLSS